MTRPRKILLGSTLLLAILGVLAWTVFHPPDSGPLYQGKPLTVWLRAYSAADGRTTTRNPATDAAVEAVGTNAIPTLLAMLRARDSRFTINVLLLARKQSLFKIPPVEASFRNVEAGFAFDVLGARASNAVPAIIQIYHGHNATDSRLSDLYALRSIGPAAAEAVPFLAQALTDTNVYIRAYAALVLEKIHAQPAVAVPALIQALADPDPRHETLKALAAYGTNAAAAVPALQPFLNDPNPTLRTAATNALKVIDPTAPAK